MHPEGLTQVRGQKLRPFWSYRGAKMLTFFVRKWAIWRLNLGVAICSGAAARRVRRRRGRTTARGKTGDDICVLR